MSSTARRMLLVGCVVITLAGGVVWLLDWALDWGPSAIAIGLVVGGITGGVVVLARRPAPTPRVETDDISKLNESRHRELIRGTSLFLREREYRYSIRLDPLAAGDRGSFSAEVNAIRIGFLPAVITDNTTDRQGYGFVAFVHDGDRWRGPGLPCPAGQAQAVQHAARCVSPLATEEETRYDGTSST